MTWLTNRWKEPESRAAVAAALTAAAGALTGQISTQTLLLALFGAAAAFAFPGAKA